MHVYLFSIWCYYNCRGRYKPPGLEGNEMSPFEVISVIVIFITYIAKITTLHQEIRTLQLKCVNIFPYFCVAMVKLHHEGDIVLDDPRYIIRSELAENQTMNIDIFELIFIRNELSDYLHTYEAEITRYGEYIGRSETNSYSTYSPFNEGNKFPQASFGW